MPLRFIRQDITKVGADAIVLPANNALKVGPGASESIYQAVGRKQMEAELRMLYPDGCEMGKAVVTPGHDRPAKWVIHAVCPQWRGGDLGEEEFLRSAYREALLLAKEKKCLSVAFPLLSTGSYMYPRMEAIFIAVDEIMRFLAENDMEVVLVLFTKDAVHDIERLFGPVRSYLEEGYTDEIELHYELRDLFLGGNLPPDWYGLEKDFRKKLAAPVDTLPLDMIMKEQRESFREMLLRLIAESGMSDPQVYKGAHLTKQNFNKIKTHANYTPKKKTILALAIALKLNTVTTVELLRKAGYTLSDYDRFDRVMKFCLDTKELDFSNINDILEVYDLRDQTFPVEKDKR